MPDGVAHRSDCVGVQADLKLYMPKKQFYQYWLNASDEDAERYMRIFTLKSKDEIEALVTQHTAEPHMRALQKALAEDITIRVHGDEALNVAIAASNILFGKSTSEDLKSLSEK